jgi:hypothetical protein
MVSHHLSGIDVFFVRMVSLTHVRMSQDYEVSIGRTVNVEP